MVAPGKSALLTKKDLGNFVTKVLNTQRMMGEVVGEREKEFRRLNRLAGNGDDGSFLEVALTALSDLAQNCPDAEIQLGAAKALATTTIAIQDSLQSARMKVTEIGVLHQQHLDDVMLKIKKLENKPGDDDMSDAELMKTYNDGKKTE